MENLYLTLLYLLSLILIYQDRAKFKRGLRRLLMNKKGWVTMITMAIFSVLLLDGKVHTPQNQALMLIGERIGNGSVLIPLITTLTYSSYLLGFNDVGDALRDSLTYGVLSGLTADVIKVGTSRGRPRIEDKLQWFRYDRIPDSEYWSFPSGHVALASGVFFSLYFRIRGKWRAIFFIFPFIVALSRIMSLSHWPSDVIFSLALGFIIAKGGIEEERCGK